MGWSIGYDDNLDRDIGYGVPAYCDHPDCHETIDRGLAYVCSDQQPYGGEEGCGLYFCSKHQNYRGQCERCRSGERPFTAKAEHPRWAKHVLTDASWASWRSSHPKKVKAYEAIVRAANPADFAEVDE